MNDDLREDEMEALLKFDGAELRVTQFDDMVSSAGVDKFIAVISSKNDKQFAGGAMSRIAAIQRAWETYQRYMVTPTEDQHNGYWLYENALANVEVQMIENLKGKKS